MRLLRQLAANVNLLQVCLTGPLYIPQQTRHVIKLLVSESPAQLTDELTRLSTLGSSWASATHAFLCLLLSWKRARNESATAA